METILNFIVKNWQFISASLVIILEFVLLLIKRGKTISIPEGFTRLIIELCSVAEKEYGAGNGDKKFQYVFEAVKKLYPTINRQAVKECVELILETPQKKGVKK